MDTLKIFIFVFSIFHFPFSIFRIDDSAWAVSSGDTCLECHQQMEGPERGPAALFSEDIHSQRGLRCSDCHGGDPTSMDPAAAMNPEKGFIGRPARSQIPQFCARCHSDPSYMRRYNPNLPTDQYLKYLTSQHGKRLNQGDSDIAVCTSCHGVHGIRSKKDPLSPVYPTNIPTTCASCHSDDKIMKRHGLPVTQHWEYAQSVHGQALLVRGDRAAPHCASCHGSHEAARPGVVAIGNVCAQCHSLTRDLFAKSPHKAAHEKAGLPECEVCHGNHLIRKPTDEMLGTSADALCVRCHEPDSKGYQTAQGMRQQIEQLKMEMTRAKDKTDQAARLGMDTSEAEFELHEAEAKLTQARTYVHSFSPTQMEPITQAGNQHAEVARQKAHQAVGEFHFRRKGLWLILVVIGILVIGLLLKIREIKEQEK